MARKKISEFRAKSLLYQALDTSYSGLSFDSSTDSLSKLDSLDKTGKYIVKVDEGIKKRFKKGLVALDLDINGVKKKIEEFQKKGYQQFLVEEYVAHESSDEQYLAIERVRDGYQFFYSKKGGINIEENQGSIQKVVIPFSFRHPELVSGSQNIQKEMLKLVQHDKIQNLLLKLISSFDTNYFSFLEINPFIILPAGRQGHDSKFIILDAAVEVDSAAEFFTNGAWSSSDFVEGEVRQKTVEEKNIEQLSSKSQASFKLDVLNPNGSIFMLLSGGGASIVLADEVANLGHGRNLANYGEYSGNPNEEETYLYTKNLLQLLLKSKTNRKVLIIAGGVANFTDVRITFRGIIKALEEVKNKLVTEKVKVFVRRGGPYQEEGLKHMREFLEKEKLFGEVSGPEMVLTEIVKKGMVSIKNNKI